MVNPMSTQSRAKSQEMRRAREAEAQRRKKQQRLFTIIGAAVIVALLVAITVVVVKAASGDDEPSTGSGAVVPPAGVTDDGGVTVGSADAPVDMTLYYDYMCPACGAFEEANGEELDRLLDDDTVRVELRPISFLDKTSQGTRYSTRAANAFATVVDGAPDKVWDFHTALFADQPEEGSEGLSDEQIASIARDVGVPDAVVERFGDMTYEGWVADVTEKAFDSGISGTPTILIDGEEFEGDPYSTGPLTAAIQAAADEQ